MLVGIGPDTVKSGVALYDTKSKSLELFTLTFFELFEKLKDLRDRSEAEHIYIEAGWLNKGNWHGCKKFSGPVAGKTGNRVGANHETGKKIKEMCVFLRLPHSLIKPTPKSSKWNAAVFQQLTGYKGRTNPETRDAARLVWGR